MSTAGADWLDRARADANRPPRARRDALHVEVGGRRVLVGSIEPALAERLVAAGLPLRTADWQGGGWQVLKAATASLAAIAEWLRAAGLAGPWRDELLAVVDADEHAVAAVERGVVRPLGLTTFAVHLVGVAFDGHGTWVQQRAFDKASDAGQWDTLMGGQVAAGETAGSALARETWEEAGLDVADLLDLRAAGRLTIRRPVAEGYMVEHIDVSVARLPAGAVPNNRDGEVERFECLDAAGLEHRLAAGEFTLEATLILAASPLRRLSTVARIATR